MATRFRTARRRAPRRLRGMRGIAAELRRASRTTHPLALVFVRQQQAPAARRARDVFTHDPLLLGALDSPTRNETLAIVRRVQTARKTRRRELKPSRRAPPKGSTPIRAE